MEPKIKYVLEATVELEGTKESIGRFSNIVGLAFNRAVDEAAAADAEIKWANVKTGGRVIPSPITRP